MQDFLDNILHHGQIVYEQPRTGYVPGSAYTSSWLTADRDLRKRVATYQLRGSLAVHREKDNP